MNEVSSLQLDVSAHCQLACPSCPTASGAVRPLLGAGHLAVGDLVALLESNPSIVDLELSNYGEMFLNPHLADILRYCFEHDIVAHADNGVNFNFASDAAIEALVKYRFRSMTCSIDGASDETYKQYRIRGNFHQVIENIRRLNNLKRQYRSGFPQLTWQFVIFGHNEHEIATAESMAAALDMRFYTKLSWEEKYSPIRRKELVQIQAKSKYVTRSEFKASTGLDYCRRICHQLWHAPVLNWDGKVLGCCRNFWGDFGVNAFQNRLVDSLNSERITYARQMLLGQVDPRNDIPCTTCDVYRTLKASGRWLTEQELTNARRLRDCTLLSVVVVTDRPVETVDIIVHSVGRSGDSAPRQQFVVGKHNAIYCRLCEPGEYVVLAIPRVSGDSICGLEQRIDIPERPCRKEVVFYI